MHPGAIDTMKAALERVQLVGGTALDVGSLNVNGTYRPLVESMGLQYVGLDIEPGANVDIVTHDPYHFPFADNSFEVVLSGSTMEHVESIWRWVPELARVLKTGGLLAILTHWQFHEHRHPVDCWRIMPDGMRHLFNSTGVLFDYDIRIVSNTDIMGSAFKAAVA